MLSHCEQSIILCPWDQPCNLLCPIVIVCQLQAQGHCMPACSLAPLFFPREHALLSLQEDERYLKHGWLAPVALMRPVYKLMASWHPDAWVSSASKDQQSFLADRICLRNKYLFWKATEVWWLLFHSIIAAVDNNFSRIALPSPLRLDGAIVLVVSWE